MKLGRRIVPTSLTQRALAIIFASPAPVSSAQLGNDLDGVPAERISALLRKHVESGRRASRRDGKFNFYPRGDGTPLRRHARPAASRPLAEGAPILPMRQSVVSALAAPPVATTGVPSVFALAGAAEEPKA